MEREDAELAAPAPPVECRALLESKGGYTPPAGGTREAGLAVGEQGLPNGRADAVRSDQEIGNRLPA